MANSPSDPLPVPAATPFVVPQNFFTDPQRLLNAATDPVRYRVLRELAAGDALTVSDLASRLGRWQDLMSKHLRVLRDLGVLTVVPAPDGDGRKQCQAIPASYRRRDETGKPMLDFGVCALRFP